MTKNNLTLLLLALSLTTGWAQNHWDNPIKSPDIQHDGHTVKFALDAPHAKDVSIEGQFMKDTKSMTKDKNGVWRGEVNISTPDIYPYAFIVDGTRIADPSNTNIFPNERFKASLLEMPSDAALYTVKDVPHGKVSYCTYHSKVLGINRPLLVYTPHGYETSNRTYPTFYLISGTTDTEETWTKVGRANIILDNLIAEGKAEEMIVVMPYGNMMNGTPRPTSMEAAEMYTTFSNELTECVMPYVAQHFRVKTGRENRAIAGFSRGGGQALFTAMKYPEMFAYLASYSAFLTPAVMDRYFPHLFDGEPPFTMLWYGVGSDDLLYQDVLRNWDYLNDKKVNYEKMLTGGGHTWMNARTYLATTMQQFFKQKNTADVATTITAPNGKVRLQPVVKDGNIVAFNLSYRQQGEEQKVLTIKQFGQNTRDGGGRGLKISSVSKPTMIKEHYDMKSGKRLTCTNEATETVYSFEDNMGRVQRMRVRLYNDGMAFRYELTALQHVALAEEKTTYNIKEGTKRWMQKWTESYEEFFPLTTTGKSNNRRWGYPALIEVENDVWALITEAGIERQHSASCLYNDGNQEDYRVVPDINTLQMSGEWNSPWRVVIVGKRKDLVESTLVSDVSEQCRLEDTSWIMPGGVSWIYWAHNHGSKDYQIVKQYIDMAAKLALPYVLIDAEWDEMGNGGDIEKALNYAKEKGVKTILWYNSSTAWTKNGGAPGPHERLNAPENREREFAWLEEKGVVGVKIDFFAGDKQETMQYCIDLLECAAKHHLLVNFHGATVPRGWQRTYPNLMSVEGVYGAEWYNNLPVLTNRAAAHNATLPFTRNVIGSMDYTPCTFSDSQHPHITTNAHELALAVLYESGLLHWADRPESYLVQPEEVKKIIGSLPTAWEETMLLEGYPGEQVVMARRKGTTWYVAGINGTDHPITLNIDLTPIVKRGKNILILEDGKKDAQKWNVRRMKGKAPKAMKCKPRGGFVMVIE